ncbi:MAG: monofunctional biosynthetic peptidoglycan transglycosylase [Acidiferrobacterales bacterium]|nr:monofunctional biosynthetic peptidoglycan transglycosylase [Acidiferrobacterales bacterium]
MIWRFRRRRYATKRRRGYIAMLLRAARWALYLVLLLILLDAFYVALLRPDWSRLAQGSIPKSRFISEYQKAQRHDRKLPPLHWRPVPLASIPRVLRQAVIIAEDSRFYEHEGFDLIAFKEAMDYNLARGRFALGASTISQQTTKNLLLSSSRNPLRKWHELILTWDMERHLSKNRILEIYLNIAEFGSGIYGVEAAARAYWGKSASALTWSEAVELAATLPSPKHHNPATRTERFGKRVEKIMHFIELFELDQSTAQAS